MNRCLANLCKQCSTKHNIKKLATLTGQGTVDKKVKLIAELLTSAEPKEARYIVRTVLEDLRVGVASGTLRDAIAWAFFEKEAGFKYADGKITVEDRTAYNQVMEKVQRAHDLTNDYGKVAVIAKEKGTPGITRSASDYCNDCQTLQRITETRTSNHQINLCSGLNARARQRSLACYHTT